MKEMRLSKGRDVKLKFVDGLAQTEILPGCSEDLKVYRGTLKSGCVWKPELFAFGDKIQFFAFITATGYVTTIERAYNIDDRAVFCPDFDNDPTIEIHAGGSDLEFYRFIGIMNDWDVRRYKLQHMVLPRFRLFREGVQYTEGFTGGAGSNLRSYLQLEGRQLGRYSMGYNIGEGPSFVGTHVHDVVEQWYFVLQDSNFTYTADKGDIELEPYDVTFTDRGVPHGSKAGTGQKINYFWVEVATDGYPEVPIADEDA